MPAPVQAHAHVHTHMHSPTRSTYAHTKICNSLLTDFVNAPHCYVIRTLLVLYILQSSEQIEVIF
jgi:hypothetical protein